MGTARALVPRRARDRRRRRARGVRAGAIAYGRPNRQEPRRNTPKAERRQGPIEVRQLGDGDPVARDAAVKRLPWR